MTRVAAAGLQVFSVTDHDTVDALDVAGAAAARLGLEWLPGIELSALVDGRDVHVLGYAFDPSSAVLRDFLDIRRKDRVRRVHEMCKRLDSLGAPVAADAVLARAADTATVTVGRPHVAAALVEAGHATDIGEAFDRFLAAGRPAYVPHRGATPEEAIDVVIRAGGLASLAHPGLLGRDDLIPRLVRAGLLAIEAFHVDHDGRATRHYADTAVSLGLSVTGGSDYHGEASGRTRALGSVTLPAAHYEALLERARAAGCARVPPPGARARRPIEP